MAYNNVRVENYTMFLFASKRRLSRHFDFCVSLVCVSQFWKGEGEEWEIVLNQKNVKIDFLYKVKVQNESEKVGEGEE